MARSRLSNSHVVDREPRETRELSIATGRMTTRSARIPLNRAKQKKNCWQLTTASDIQ